MRKIIALLLIYSQVAFAGLPPTSTQGQSDSSAKVKFQFQTPLNQSTDLGGIKTLIETGNTNMLPDPGFESAVSGWTASGGATAAANATAKGTGALGYDWDSNSAAQTLVSTSVTIPNGYQGKNGIASCNIKTPSGTATTTIVVNDGTNDIGTAGTILSGTTFLASNYNFVFPSSGTIRLKLTSVNANEPEIYIDDCVISLASNVYNAPLITDWVAYTPSAYQGLGTPTAVSLFYRRVGGSVEINGKLTAGTTTASEMQIALPSGLTSADTTKIASIIGAGNLYRGANNAATNYVLIEPSKTYMTFSGQSGTQTGLTKLNASSVVGSSETFSIQAFIPIQGWSTGSAVSADQADFGDTLLTLTSSNTQGIGTPTGSCTYSRVSDKLKMFCKVTNGTATASEMRINLPNGLISADTTRIPSIQLAGYATIAATNANQFQVYIEPSVGYLTFGYLGAAQAGLTKQTGLLEFGTSATYSFTAEVPIQGWSSNQRAPTLVGSVTSNANNAERIERAKLNLSAAGTVSITSQSGSWITSATAVSSIFTLTYPAATWSAAPSCTFVCNASSNNVFPEFNTAPTTTALSGICSNVSGTATLSNAIDIICMGPR
jgi:hypothetical protein